MHMTHDNITKITLRSPQVKSTLISLEALTNSNAMYSFIYVLISIIIVKKYNTITQDKYKHTRWEYCMQMLFIHCDNSDTWSPLVSLDHKLVASIDLCLPYLEPVVILGCTRCPLTIDMNYIPLGALAICDLLVQGLLTDLMLHSPSHLGSSLPTVDQDNQTVSCMEWTWSGSSIIGGLLVLCCWDHVGFHKSCSLANFAYTWAWYVSLTNAIRHERFATLGCCPNITNGHNKWRDSCGWVGCWAICIQYQQMLFPVCTHQCMPTTSVRETC